MTTESTPPGYERVFCSSFIHPVTKRRVYPKKGKSFSFLVKKGKETKGRNKPKK